MPRLPGREPTRRTVKSTDGLLVASFLMPHEDKYWARPCVIEGCDHRMGNINWPTDRDWQPCSDKALPAFAVQNTAIHQSVGLLCPCHVAEVLEADWPDETPD